MSLLFMDSFDHYATADITEKWTEHVRCEINGSGRNGTSAMLIGVGSNTGHVTVTCLGGVATAIVGVAVKFTTFNSVPCPLVILGSASEWECGLRVNADGTLQAWVATSTFNPDSAYWWQTVGAASVTAMQTGVWYYVEVKMTCNDSTGSIQARLNGIEVLNQTGLDTKYSSTSLTRAGCAAGSGQYVYIDDLVVMDTTGAVNNAFLGDVTVSALYPNGAGTTTGWTPSAGSNYDNVNEAAPNDDTDYNSTAVATTKDTYAMQNCAAGADIKAVQILAAVRKAAEGPGKVKLVTRSNSTDYDGTEQGIGGTSYSYVREVLETDPATAAAWSESGWNAVEIGLKKTG
jgi:hypothetical protein